MDPMTDEALEALRGRLARVTVTDPVSGSGVSPDFSFLSLRETQELLKRLDALERPSLSCACPKSDLRLRPTFVCRSCGNVYLP